MKLHVSSPPRRRGVAAVAAGVVLALGLAACSGGDAAQDDPTEGTAAQGEIDQDAVIEAGISYSLSGGFDPMITTGAATVGRELARVRGTHRARPRRRARSTRRSAPTSRRRSTTPTTRWTSARARSSTTARPSPSTTSSSASSASSHPASESLYACFIDFIESVTPVDDDTVSINLKYPFSLVPERLSVVKVVPKALVESDYEAFNALPVGTGPFKMTQATPDDKITFERFDDYNGRRPALAAGLVWNLLSDPAARVTAMSSGTVSAIEDVPYIDVPTLEGAVDVESVQSFGTLFMMFNTDLPPFDDVRVRQAFFYALDMDKIIDNGLLGNGAAATSFLPQSHPNYHEASTVYSYDPEKAKSLLAEAGVSDLSITLLTTDTGWFADIAPLIKENLDVIGVDTTLDIGQSGGQYTKVDNGDLQVMVAPGDPSVFGNDPDLLMRWWYGDNVWSQSRYRWNDDPKFAELQSILDAAVRTSGDEQQELWDEAFDLISTEVPLYPLLHRKLPTAWDGDTLSGFKPLPITGLSFLDAGLVK